MRDAELDARSEAASAARARVATLGDGAAPSSYVCRDTRGEEHDTEHRPQRRTKRNGHRQRQQPNGGGLGGDSG